MELAGLLYNVFDRTVDGDPKGPPLYRTWGYDNFEDYVDRELGFSVRKAQRLRLIWYKLEVELAGMDPKLKQRVVNLGWSKVRELMRVITLKNAAEWADRAEEMSYIQLEDAIRRKKRAQDRKDAEKSVAKAKVESGQADSEDEEVDPFDLDNFDKNKPQEFKFLHFALSPAQFILVDEALKRAAEVARFQGDQTKRMADSRNLEFICSDFLGTNHFQGGGLNEKLRYVKKLEEILGMRLVAFDVEGEKLLHGYDTLDKFIEALKKGAGDSGGKP